MNTDRIKGLCSRLAAMDGSSREAIEATIALWPLEDRAVLERMGVIERPPFVLANRWLQIVQSQMTEEA